MKVRQSGQICLNPKLLIRIILENGYEVNLMWKTNSLRVQNNNILHFFSNFWLTKLKILLWKLGKAWKLVWIWSLSWEVFYQTTLWMKANVMSNSKWHFPSFCKFLSDVTKTVFWESKKHCVKSVQIWSFTCPYFPVLGLNTEIYGINLRIQLRYWKIRTRKNSVFGHFARSEKVFKIVIIKSWS